MHSATVGSTSSEGAVGKTFRAQYRKTPAPVGDATPIGDVMITGRDGYREAHFWKSVGQKETKSE